MDAFPSPTTLKRIGLIEDDEHLALLLRYNIEATGASVHWFADGQNAISWLRACPPDAVILDWELPGLSGIEILRLIRCFPGTRKLPVLMLTGRTESRDRARALSLGADAFIAKPFSVREVLSRLRDALEMSFEPSIDRELATDR
jgi:two-component system phosphate regulon response regulator PhoB